MPIRTLVAFVTIPSLIFSTPPIRTLVAVAVTIPLFIFSSSALSFWRALRQHAVPQEVPWAHSLHTGIAMAAVSVCTFFSCRSVLD